MEMVTSQNRREDQAHDDTQWRSIVARDRAADGRFVFAVTTTGIFCRPSCPARRARREHVRFFETPVAAVRAGFRACRRCDPESVEPRHVAIVTTACRLLDEPTDGPPRLEALARAAGLSASHFHRVFKATTGLTPREYAAGARGRRVRQLLVSSPTITDAMYSAGFGSGGRFYAASDALLGMTASEYRAGGARVAMQVAVRPCSLGHVLVAMSQKGVCAILLGEDPARLMREVADQFPRATLTRDDAAFRAAVARVVALVDGQATSVALPLDVRGTAFERRVWRALVRIPAGETASYGEVARRIGAPGSARAVARACAANVLAVAIPCHRVVRQDGAVAGYRWGVARKQTLLAREQRRR